MAFSVIFIPRTELDRRLVDALRNVLAELKWIGAGFVGPVLPFLCTICEARQSDMRFPMFVSVGTTITPGASATHGLAGVEVGGAER